jgi:hypothetical protein
LWFRHNLLLFSRDAFPHSPTPSNRGKISSFSHENEGANVWNNEASSSGSGEKQPALDSAGGAVPTSAAVLCIPI